MSESFGARLRQQRERQQIALTSIAEQTKISLSLLEGLERDDVLRWPAGIFRRAFVRAYAHAIGLEPDLVVREFLELHPDPVEDVTGRGGAASTLRHVASGRRRASVSSTGVCSLPGRLRRLSDTTSVSAGNAVDRIR